MAVRTKDSVGTTRHRSVQAQDFADAALGAGITLINGTLVPSVGSSALTIAIKTKAGTDPSVSDPVLVAFRNATAATGDYIVRRFEAAANIVVSSTSTLGTANSIPFRLWVVAFDDAGTLRLGVVNTLSGTNIMPLSGWGIASSTAEGGAGAADSAQVIYTGTAVTSKAYAVLGYMTWESGLATAGTWSGGPTRTQLLAADTPLPGTEVQRVYAAVSTSATGTTVLPIDNTIPQSTEGDQYMGQAITPTSAANVLEIGTQVLLGASTSATTGVALFQDSTANALKAVAATIGGAGFNGLFSLLHVMLAGTTSATTFKVRAGLGVVGTTTFNGAGGTQQFGGVAGSHIQILEIMR